MIDPNAPIDPNDPQAIIRQRALSQAAGTDPNAPVGTTPSPTFTPTSTAPTAGTAPVSATTSPFTPDQKTVTAQANQLPAGTPGTYAPNSPNDPKTPVPSYVNMQDPAQSLVYQGFAGKGMTPRDQSDFQYWVDKINSTGGMTPGNVSYWTNRMAQGQGGAGDYLERPEAGATATTGQANPFLDSIRGMLMDRLKTDMQPVDPNDVSIAQPLSAASDQASRAQDQERKVMAERLYAQGGGNVDQAQLSQGIQQSAEKNALGLGSLKAQLITQALTAKRQDLSDAMQLAIASGDAESARSISMQLAALNAQIQREGFGVQREGIGANLAISAANQNAGTVNAGLNG